MKRIFPAALLTIASILWFASATIAQESTDWLSMNNYLNTLGLSQETVNDLKDLIEHRSPPLLKNIGTTPENPQDGMPVVVTASFSRNLDTSGAVSEAYVYFTTDGGRTWSRVAMEQDTEDDRIWRGTIPGQPSGTEVIYAVQALNSFDEMYMEAACETKTGLPENIEKTTPKECNSEKSAELCAVRWPNGCIFPMSASPGKFAVYTDETSNINPDLNIRTARIGYDIEHVFLDMTVRGAVSPGKLSPIDIHFYIAGWLNPDQAGNDTGLDAIMNQGAAMIFAPLNPSTNCAVYYLRGPSLTINIDSGTCEANENHLLLSIKRDIMKPNQNGTMEFVFLTLAMRNMSPPDVKLVDSSLFTRVRFGKRGYTIP